METNKLILPKNCNVFTYIFNDTLEYNNDSPTCLMCGKEIETRHQIPTLFEGKIGSFCSKGCTEIMSSCIAHAVPLRTPPRMKLPHLSLYKNPEKLLDILHQTDTIYFGHQQRLESGKVKVMLKKVNSD